MQEDPFEMKMFDEMFRKMKSIIKDNRIQIEGS